MVEDIRQVAEAAGREIMAVYRSTSWTVTEKADQSPLTIADLRANEVILNGLSRLTSELIVSEESEPGKVSPPGAQAFWLVDPLDGTRDFVERRDTFVVCLARVENHFPVFGMIHWPVSGETWWAEKGRGAFGPTGERIYHQERRPSLVCAGSRSTPSDRMQRFYDHFDIKDIQRYGSALKFCRLAEGGVDLYPRFGPTSEWDTAAGQVIAEESGCKVIEVSSGERLRYGKPAFENRGGFIASRSDLDFVGPLHAAGWVPRFRS